MMELDVVNIKKKDPVADATKVVAPAKKEVKMVGSLRYRRGLTLFYLNLKTGNWGKVPLQKQATFELQNKGARYKAQFNPDAIYIYALNEKNFLKKVESKLRIKLPQDAKQ